ncbi:MAG: hypothetical protein DRG78_07690 [Epsilonproteobacteria bacterium]|nr:MAG: hypothetical protein DRG78_07690 [Campylobacterota bacterium]
MKKTIILLLINISMLMANHNLTEEPKLMQGVYDCVNTRTNKLEITLDLQYYSKDSMRYKMTNISNFSSVNGLAWSMYHNDYTKKDYLVLRLKNNSGEQVEFSAKKQEIYLDNKHFSKIPLVCKKIKGL